MNIYKSKTEKAGRQTMQTPPGIAEWCSDKWGCNIDLAASATNKKFHHYFSDVVGDEKDGYIGNALSDYWQKLGTGWNCVGFCNPPYENLGPWLSKAKSEADLGFTSVFLIPSFNGDQWAFYPWLWAREIILIEGRINFIKESDGLPLSGNGRGSMLCVFGPRAASGPSFGYVRLHGEILPGKLRPHTIRKRR